MSTGKQLTALLLFTTALTLPAAAFAQDAGVGTGAEGVPADEDAATDALQAQEAQGIDNTPQEEEFEEPDISVPGGSIVVTGRRRQDVTRASSQVVSVLDSASIARSGEGDIAGALTRVTGLSTVGNGLVFVRGLGDRYSLALLNGLPLPSPQPLSRVVPLDIFPTSVIASSLVQKTYSANFPGEFGGGVINLTTRAVPDESFVKVSAGISGDTETTFGTGYSYYGSDYDWFGFDAANLVPICSLSLTVASRSPTRRSISRRSCSNWAIPIRSSSRAPMNCRSTGRRASRQARASTFLPTDGSASSPPPRSATNGATASSPARSR